jgi:peptidyl-prolyl cis-trans isomerase D
VKINLLQEKFVAVTSKAVSANSLDAKQNFDFSKTSYNVNYVVQPYFLVPDSTIKIADSDIRALYNKRREQYKQEASRTINYVVFDVLPSKEDYDKAQKTVTELNEEFKTTADAVVFVKTNSDVRTSEAPYSEKTVPEELKDFAFSGKVGDITEPTFENDTYTVARIVETGILRPDSVKLRHIFLTTANEGKTDSIVDALKKGADFAALARQYSAAQTAQNGGEIGWMIEFDGMDKDTKTLLFKAFDTKVNEIFTEKNTNGVQIMQVVEKTQPLKKVQLAILKINVTPSNITVSNIYNSAKQFAAELTGAEFQARADEKGYQVRTAADLQTTAEKIADINNSRQIVRWAFENKKGTVSDVYECNDKFVVATLTSVSEKGYRPYEELQIQLRSELVRDKKAVQMSKTLAEQIAKNPSLEALGASIQSEVKTAENVNFSAYQFGGAGYEPQIIGAVSGLEIDKLSAPVKGNAGVYVLQPTSKTDSELPYDTKTQIAQLNQRLAYSLPYGIINDLRSKAKITDNRLRFY